MGTQVIRNIAQQRLVIFCVSLGSFMALLDAFILNISLPTIANYFNVSPGIISWLVTIYLIMLSSTLLIFGKIGDKVGFRNVFVFGFILFCAGSLLCCLSWNLALLILGRCIQGLGGAIIYALGPAILNTFLPHESRGKAFGIRTSASALGIGLGVPLGGLIVTFLDWHWIFFINIPIALFAGFYAYKFIPSASKKSSFNILSFDWVGALLIFIGVVCLMYALNMVDRFGWSSPIILICFVISFITLIFFVYHEGKVEDPLLDINFFKNFIFLFANVATFLAYMLLAASTFLLPFYLIDAKGLSPLESSMVLLLYPMIAIFLAPIIGWVSDRVNPRHLRFIGMFIMTCTSLIFVFTLSGFGLLPAIFYTMFMGISYSFFIPANNHFLMRLAPRNKQGAASGTFKMVVHFGMALGVCVFETVFSFSLPREVSAKGLSLASAHISHIILFAGFQKVFAIGVIVCIIILVIFLLGYIYYNHRDSVV